MIVFVYVEQYIFSIKENMMCQEYSNGMFNYRIKFKFNYKIYIKIMRCKIIRSSAILWDPDQKKKKKKLWFYIIV